jgi:hypothetical protein
LPAPEAPSRSTRSPGRCATTRRAPPRPAVTRVASPIRGR